MNELGPIVQALYESLPDNFASDAFKSFVGSLFGAGLAFVFALRKEAITQKKAQKAAGNLATTTLAKFWNDFFQVRGALLANRAEVLAQEPRAPIWMQMKPTPFGYPENLRFDVASLTFMFEHKDGPDVFEKLLTVEIKYHSFFNYLREHGKVAQEAQDVLAITHPDPNKGLRPEEYLAALGFARIARMESLVQAIFL